VLRPAKITSTDHNAAPPNTIELPSPSQAPGVAATTGTATIIANDTRIIRTVIRKEIVMETYDKVLR